jgi:hypothetical protein
VTLTGRVVGWAVVGACLAGAGGTAVAAVKRTADLQVKAVGLSASTTRPGGTLTVRDTTVNRGPIGAKASRTTYYLSKNSVKDSTDTVLASRSVKALKATARSKGSATAVIPSAAAPGTYRILACADARSKVKESRERNNCRAAGPLSVVAAGPVVEPGTTPAPTETPSPTPTETPTPSPTPTPTATPDPSLPLDGFATMTGTCGVVAPQLADPDPSLFGSRNLDFGADPYDDPGDRPLLTAGGQTIAATPGAGGGSSLSEVFAFEALARCEGASLLKTGTEIVYDQPGKTTDLLVRIAGVKVGVAVARAVGFPPGSPYTSQSATTLLDAKLDAVNESSQHVAAQDAWVKQVLVVMAYDQQHADTIAAAWSALGSAIKADTVVYVVVTDGSDANLYGA